MENTITITIKFCNLLTIRQWQIFVESLEKNKIFFTQSTRKMTEINRYFSKNGALKYLNETIFAGILAFISK